MPLLTKSPKATWIKKYLDSGNRDKWKNFFNLALGKYGSLFFELGNLNRKDIDKLKIEDPFIKEIVEIWSDTFFERKIVSKDHLPSLPLLQNSLISNISNMRWEFHHQMKHRGELKIRRAAEYF